jgi:hypothetical protein
MKCKNDTNSGHPLLDVDVYEDWMEIECPVCKTKHELTDSHLDAYSQHELPFPTYILAPVLILGFYQLGQLIKFVIELWKT